MRPSKHVGNVLIAATAVLFAGGRFVPSHDKSGPVLTKAIEIVSAKPVLAPLPTTPAGKAKSAVSAIRTSVRKLSHPRALEDAFRSYFAYKAEHPAAVKKPLLYFVDYGL